MLGWRPSRTLDLLAEHAEKHRQRQQANLARVRAFAAEADRELSPPSPPSRPSMLRSPARTPEPQEVAHDQPWWLKRR